MKFITLGKHPEAPTERQIEDANAVLAKAKDAHLYGLKEAAFLCEHCGETQGIKDTVYIIHYWYERPYGCNGGDEWHRDLAKDTLLCNSCGDTTRIGKCEYNYKTDLFKDVKEMHAD